MNVQAAMQAASRRAAAEGLAIDVWFDADSPALDWRDRYLACRYIDRPAHGRHVCTANPDGQFITVTQEADPVAPSPQPARPRRPVAPAPPEEPYTNPDPVARLAQRLIDLFPAVDPSRVWTFDGIEDQFWNRPSLLHDDTGFKLSVKYSEHDRRVIVEADYGPLSRHRHRADDPARATYSPTRSARAMAADIVRRVIVPGRQLYARYQAEEAQHQARLKHAAETAASIVAASRGYIELPDRGQHLQHAEDQHLYLNHSRRGLYLTGRVSAYSGSVTLERVELPLEILLLLAAAIADYVDRHPPEPD